MLRVPAAKLHPGSATEQTTEGLSERFRDHRQRGGRITDTHCYDAVDVCALIKMRRKLLSYIVSLCAPADITEEEMGKVKCEIKRCAFVLLDAN